MIFEKFRNKLAEKRTIKKLRHLRTQIQIASIEQTIEKIKTDNCSISRFGDGEFMLMEGKSISFQKASCLLSCRLSEVFIGKDKSTDQLLICINGWLNKKTFDDYTEGHVQWINKQFNNSLGIRLKHIDLNKCYYDLMITRFWLPFKDKNKARNVAVQLKSIWENRDVVIIEGDKTRMGVGNDLLYKCKSCKRILCPATDAFDFYDEILSSAKSFAKDVLFLIALGPTATVLAYDLCKEGYQALDMGHVDVEYEMMKRNAYSMQNIDNKYVNEASGGDIVLDIFDEKYVNEIVFKIGVDK